MKREDLVRRVTRQLADLRRQEGVTQEELAERLDVPVQHVSRIEAGQNVTLMTVERIAVALGMNVTLVFEASGDGPKKPPKTRRQKLTASKQGTARKTELFIAPAPEPPRRPRKDAGQPRAKTVKK